MAASLNCGRSERSVKCARTEHAGLPFAEGSAGPFVQLSRSIIEVWNCLDQESWGRFCVVSKWMNWSARFPGHGVHARWIDDKPPGPSVVAQNALRSVHCGTVRHTEPTGPVCKAGCAAVAQVLGRCSALQKLTIILLDQGWREVDNANMARLSHLIQLRELRVIDGETLSGLDSLTTMSCLEVLELKPVDLTQLPVLTSVRDLQLQPLDTKITEETAQRLAWPSLTALSLEGGWLSGAATERLTRSGKLRRLEAVSFDMVVPAPALVHVTVQGWLTVKPPSAPLFHKDLSHLAVYQALAIRGTWCLSGFMEGTCPASLQTLALGCPSRQDTTETWAFARWVTGASRPSLRAMDLAACDYVRHPGFGSWLQEMKELRRLQVGTLPDDVRLPQLHELSICREGQRRIDEQIRKLPLWVPELRVLWLWFYATDMDFAGHLLTGMSQLRCLVLDGAGSTKTTIWKILDEMLGCTCDCPETFVHVPKLRLLRIAHISLRSDDKPRWLLKAKARNIVVAHNYQGWSLDHCVYTE